MYCGLEMVGDLRSIAGPVLTQVNFHEVLPRKPGLKGVD